MRLIVGLGNPGSQYDLTRHNIGKRSVIALAETERLSFLSDAKLKASICSWNYGEEKVLLAYSNTFMNHTGEAVKLICDYYKIQTDKDVLVVSDDVALPFGTIRLRASGSTGGHNGLASIESAVGHAKYARLRIGVGEHINVCDSVNDFLKGKPLEDFVLEKFKDADEKKLSGVLADSVKACRAWLDKPFLEATSLINIKKYSD